MCGAYALPCPICHPSCDCTVTPGVCSSCKDSNAELYLENRACRCKVGYGATFLPYHATCGSCHGSCGTCYDSGSGASCYTCSVSTAVLEVSNSDRGRCVCGAGYRMFLYPTLEANCVPCVGCSSCTATGQCFVSEEAHEAISSANLVGLPISTPGAVCFRLGTEFPNCDHDVLEGIMGPIEKDYYGNLQPTEAQCAELLNANWPFAEYWLKTIFPNYSPPTTFLALNLQKNILRLWIQQFHPSLLVNDPDWKPLIDAINAPAANWSNYLSWGGVTPGYTLDGGTTLRLFPPQLQAFLEETCSTAGCNDVNLLNAGSTVCFTPSCALPSTCQMISTAYPCRWA
jgi:hypothetical protein